MRMYKLEFLSVIAALLLSAGSGFVCAQKVRYGQPPPKAKQSDVFPIKVHVSGVHFRTEYESDGLGNTHDMQPQYVTYVDATLDGQNVELKSYMRYEDYNFGIGDYRARLYKASKSRNAIAVGGEYELLMPNNTIWRCTEIGFSE